MDADEYIWDHWEADPYASFFLMLKRLPAINQSKWRDIIDTYKLFCTYKGERYRVMGASRLGDIWLTKDFDRQHGYDLRVDLDECSEWSPTPAVPVK